MAIMVNATIERGLPSTGGPRCGTKIISDFCSVTSLLECSIKDYWQFRCGRHETSKNEDNRKGGAKAG